MLGRFISGAGSYFNLVALNLFTLIKTNSPLLTGIGMGLKVLAGCLASPYLGKIADKVDRKLGMILSDIILGFTMFFLAISPNGNAIVAIIFLVQIFLGVFQNFFLINFQAAMPVFAPTGNLVKANSWFQVTNCTTVILGAISAFTLIGYIGYRGAFIVDGLSYFASFIILISLPQLQTREKKSENVIVVKEGFFDGIKYLVIAFPSLFFIFFVRWLDGVGSGSHNVALPIFGELTNPANPNKVFGLILSAWGVGCLLSAIFINYLDKFKKTTDATLKNIFIYSTALMSVFWILIFQNKNPLLLLLIAVIAGIFDTAATVTYSVILQKTVDAVRGRVMALSTISLSAGLGCGMVFASLMAGIFSPAILVLLWHGIPILVIAIFFMVFVWRFIFPTP